MHKVVYNTCYGGYCLSKAAVEWLAENGREEIRAIAQRYIDEENLSYGSHVKEIARHDPDLVRCVETLGEAANGDYAELCVCVLRGNQYRIDEYGGWESVIEPYDDEYITIQ